MADYTIKRLEDVEDVLGDYPGEMRMMTGGLEAEQVAFTYRLMPQHTGGKGSYGHRHKEQEEVYYVASGKLQFKLGDDVVELERSAVQPVRPVVQAPGQPVLVVVAHRSSSRGESSGWSWTRDRIAARARLACDLTVPTEMPRTAAVSASLRSS